MNTAELIERMYLYYSRDYTHTCETCCNCKPCEEGCADLICIAYGKKYSVGWDKNSCACGLYNQPFRKNKHHLTVMGAVYANIDKQKKRKKEKVIPGQMCLF